ncbi:hypothetical protein HY091_00020 [Candidatus Kaiserbacteria bacterium]|nr:hypothetical protein [Candidatus Kaiserbacteria bacterium]
MEHVGLPTPLFIGRTHHFFKSWGATLDPPGQLVEEPRLCYRLLLAGRERPVNVSFGVNSYLWITVLVREDTSTRSRQRFKKARFGTFHGNIGWLDGEAPTLTYIARIPFEKLDEYLPLVLKDATEEVMLFENVLDFENFSADAPMIYVDH